MEEHRNESGQRSGSSPTENVNVQLATTLTQIVKYIKRQETRVETLEIFEDICFRAFSKIWTPKI